MDDKAAAARLGRGRLRAAGRRLGTAARSSSATVRWTTWASSTTLRRSGLAAAEAAIAEGKVHYIALGDRHSTTQVGETGRIWYAGAPEPTAHDETDAGNVLLVDLEDGACTVTPRPVGTWRFVAETLELDATSGPETLRDRLDGLPAKDRSIVRLTLLGVLSLTEYTRLQQIIEEAREVFGSIEEWEPDEPVARATR